jgi:iron complex transport system substrate-binding protein
MIPDPRSGRWLRAFALLAFFAAVILACADKRAEQTTGKRRIVAIGGPITETVFALGAGDDVVATDTSSVYPAATAQLPKVGYQRLLNAEGVLAQRPDLVIASDDAGPPAALQQIRAAGVPVEIMPTARTIDEAAARVLAVGKAIDRPAQQLADQVQTSAKAAKPSTKGTRFMLVYARGGGTMLVSGTDTPAAAMVELAGGTNAFTAFTGFKALSPEAMIAAAPDVIVIPTRGLASIGGAAGLLAAPGVAETPAGKAKRIIAIDDLLLLGFGPRLAVGIEELAAQL